MRRNLRFVALVALSLIVFWGPLSTLARFAFQGGSHHRYDHYSHIVLIPLISACLVYWDRKKIFSNVESGYGAGALLLLAAMGLYLVGRIASAGWSENNSLAFAGCSVFIFWMGSFLFCYGTRAFRAAAFPLLFGVLIVPIPDLLLEGTIRVLQSASTGVTALLFQLTGVPFLREGTIFALPGLTFDVAPECSGIRSSLALFITSLLAGHFLLRSRGSKLLLVLSVFPIAVLKNGVRIVALTLLAAYVDPSFLTGSLHSQGGVLFFVVVGLGGMAAVLWSLQKAEKRMAVASPSIPQSGTRDGESHGAGSNRDEWRVASGL